MFFLGASAHIIIYLLVPAFLTVCLFINGQPGTPEMGELFPAEIAYEPQISGIYGRDTFCISFHQQQAKQEIIENRDPVFQSPPVRTDIYDAAIPNSLSIRLYSLRAPPSC